MIASVLCVTDEGNAYTFLTDIVRDERGILKLVKGPAIPCNLVQMRVLGRNENGLFDQDVLFK